MTSDGHAAASPTRRIDAADGGPAAHDHDRVAELESRVAALQRLLERARDSRREAERVLEERSRALWEQQAELAASEERFRTLAESIGDMVVSHDAAGVVTWASPSTRRLLGHEPQAMVGRPLAWFMHPDDAHDPASHLGPSSGPAGCAGEFSCRARYLTVSGAHRWMDSRTAFRFDADGGLLGGSTVIRDVDEQVTAEAALQESRRHYRLLAENSGDVVLLLNAQGRIEWASPSVERLMGWRPADLVGTATFDLAHPDDLPRVVAGRVAVMEGEQAAFQTRARRGDGGWRWLNVVSRAVRDEAGAVTGIVTNWRDAEADVAARQTLETAYEETAAARSALQTSLDASVDAFAIYDIERAPQDRDRVVGLRLLLMNTAGADPMGLDSQDLVGRELRDFYPDAERTGLWDAMLRAIATDAPVFHRNEVAGDPLTWDNWITPVGEDRIVNVWRNVTEQVRAERELAASEEQFRVAMTTAPVPMFLLALDGRLQVVNDALVDMLGWDRDVLRQRSLQELVHPDDADLAVLPDPDGVDVRARYTRELRLTTRHGGDRWGLLSVAYVRDAAGSATHAVAQILDVTEVRASQDALAHQALHDPLTGLANRALFGRELDSAVARMHRSGLSVVVMFCDLDHFKPVNDTYGHEAGDAVLVEVARRLERAVRASDVVARLGGDEFVLLAEGLRIPGEARSLAERVRASLGEPIAIPDGQARISASIGLAIAAPGEAPMDIVRRADHALYEAKAAGRDQWRVSGDGS